MKTQSKLIIYENSNIEAIIQNETLWLNQEQIAQLFSVQRPAITKHLNNIFKDGELDEKVVCSVLKLTTKHGAMANKTQNKRVKFYNLDAILSVGYRVNSKKATKFRIWATQILRNYLIKGSYNINQAKITHGLNELNSTLKMLQNAAAQKELNLSEAKGMLDIVLTYARSWSLLQGYDEGSLSLVYNKQTHKFILDISEARKAISELKNKLVSKGEASELFGKEKADEFEGILQNIYQTFGGEDLLVGTAQKAANLLYYIIKDHPFVDVNKRIGAFMFILFLNKSNALYKQNGDYQINDNALVAISLLVATSEPKDKDNLIKLIVNLLTE